MKENIVVFGGDGFCGWPTSLHLSKDYNIIIVDNLSRRKIDVELECESLTPIKPISKRLEVWKKLTGIDIKFEYIDVSDHYHRILSLFKEVKPKAVIHFAEQRAAPYSMKSSFHKRYTIQNNVMATNNILCAIVESGLDIHMIHLGTTGFYGYSSVGMRIPEGYLPVKVNVDGIDREIEIMYPPNPGSIYHLTKVQDAMSFYYFNKNDNVRITDLHQGIVWGTQTEETLIHEDIINRFDYEGDYGTCFLPGTKITTSKGFCENIEHIKENDKVITHKGRSKKVTHKFERLYSGDIFTIRTKYRNQRPIRCTGNHQLLIGEMKRDSTGHQKEIEKIGWIQSSKLFDLMNETKKKYYVYSPLINNSLNFFEIDVKKELNNLNIFEKDGYIYPQNPMSKKAIGGIGIPQKIIMNNDISRLFGYYLAEGSGTKYQTSIVFNISEDEYVEDVLDILKNYFDINGKITVRKDSAIIIKINSILLSSLFRKLMGVHSKHKRIDERILFSKSIKGVVKGYWYGDGCYSGKNVSFSSCNNKLLEQIQTALMCYGIPCSIHERDRNIEIILDSHSSKGIFKESNLQIPFNYRTRFFKKIIENNEEDESNIMFENNEDLMLSIFNIEKEKYNGLVYNLEVEDDNTYLVNGISVHNCLNRFLMQSQVGHPLTVHGSGGQTRAFINIQDTVKCIKIAVENPPLKNERVKIFNQTTECLNIKDLALKISEITGAEIRYYKNPRNEDDRNDLKFCNDEFMRLGLNPVTLDNGLLKEIMDIARKYSYRCDKSKIICTSIWRSDMEIDFEGSCEV